MHCPTALHTTLLPGPTHRLPFPLGRPRAAWSALAMILGLFLFAPPLYAEREVPPPLPAALSNHPFARLITTTGDEWLTLTGLGAGKTWRDLHAGGYWWRSGMAQWQPLPALPDGKGRLAAQLVSAAGAFWFMGGYTVAADGTEVSTPDVYRVTPGDATSADYSQRQNVNRIYHPQPAMPVPVDDATVLVYQDRYIYLISGWHDVGNVNLVQIFDTHTRTWRQGEPWPGTPVFGQAGAIIGQQLAVCGGARIHYPPSGTRQFVLSPECWQGTIRGDDPRRIDWRPMPPQPGAARYRAAAAGITFRNENWIVFLGGTDNPYNYNGRGYDGQPAQPLDSVWGFNLQQQRWCRFNPMSPAGMDYRGAVALARHRVVLLGGMNHEQVVSNQAYVWHAEKLSGDCTGS